MCLRRVMSTALAVSRVAGMDLYSMLTLISFPDVARRSGGEPTIYKEGGMGLNAEAALGGQSTPSLSDLRRWVRGRGGVLQKMMVLLGVLLNLVGSVRSIHAGCGGYGGSDNRHHFRKLCRAAASAASELSLQLNGLNLQAN